MSTHHAAPVSTAIRIKALAIAALSIGIVFIIGAGLGDWITTTTASAQKSPFSVGIREGGGATTGLAALILNVQARFSKAMTSSLMLFRDGETGLFLLIGLGFAYGVFHAIGPGHGKAVIAAYAFSHEKAIGRSVGMASAAAALQTIVAIALVTVFSVIINVTAPTMKNASHLIEIVSFLAIAIVGVILLWNKSKDFAFQFYSMTKIQNQKHEDHNDPNDYHTHQDSDGHIHAPIVPAGSDLKYVISALFAAGIRPCSGSILILVFALSQNLYYAGIFGAIAIGIGTAVTTSAIAVFAILLKQAATKLIEKRDTIYASLIITILEALAAAFVFILGASLLLASLSTRFETG